MPESQQQSGRLEVHVTAATADVWDHATLRREELDDNDMGPMLQELEAG
jgi:hypothetical protein